MNLALLSVDTNNECRFPSFSETLNRDSATLVKEDFVMDMSRIFGFFGLIALTFGSVWSGGGAQASTTASSLPASSMWMSQVPDRTALGNIMMPGSHDAGMSETHHCKGGPIITPWVQTQDQSIASQLDSGSRYFDIRVDYDHDELVTYHRNDGGTGCNGQSFASVLAQVRHFLSAHQSETVILKISHIRSDSGHNATDTKGRIVSFLDQLGPDYQSAIYKTANATIKLEQIPLSAVRGKMMLAFDYGSGALPTQSYIWTPSGRFRYMDGFVVSSTQCDGQPANLTVCDRYSDTNKLIDMMNGQMDKWYQWHRAGGRGRGQLFLLSWTLTPKGITGVRGLANEANGELAFCLYRKIRIENWTKPNIVYIDYVNRNLAATIYQYNLELPVPPPANYPNSICGKIK